MIKYIHVVNTYKPPQAEVQGRLDRAASTWALLRGRYPNMIMTCYRDVAWYGRNSALVLADRREVPFVRDVIDSALSRGVTGEDVVILTNADSCLVPETLEMIVGALEPGGRSACYSARQDVDKVHRSWLTASDIVRRGQEHRGVDLVAFRWSWWTGGARERYPDMLLGYEGWDAIFGMLIDSWDGSGRIGPCVYHEIHESPYWYQYRLVSPGNLYNRRLARAWLVAGGLYEKACSVWPGMRQYK